MKIKKEGERGRNETIRCKKRGKEWGIFSLIPFLNREKEEGKMEKKYALQGQKWNKKRPCTSGDEQGLFIIVELNSECQRIKHFTSRIGERIYRDNKCSCKICLA